MNDDPELDRWPSLRLEVDPLPGGLGRLRAGLDGERRRGWWVRGSAGAALATALLALVVLRAAPRPADDARDAARELLSGEPLPHPDAVALGLAPPAPEPLRDPRVGDAGKIVLVWVEASPSPGPAPRFIDAIDEGSLVR